MPSLTFVSEMAGVSKSAFQRLCDEALRNQKNLNSCATPHRFGKVLFRNGMASRVTCDVCNGEMQVHDAMLFRRGFAAAGGNPETVMSERLLKTGPT